MGTKKWVGVMMLPAEKPRARRDELAMAIGIVRRAVVRDHLRGMHAPPRQDTVHIVDAP